MKIGIIVAMDKEYDLVEKLLGGAEGKVGENHISLRRCGMGKVNAAVGAAEMIRDARPDCILSTGVAGGLSPEVGPMDVVVADEIVYHDAWYGAGNAFGQVQGMPERFRTDRTLHAAAVGIDTGGLTLHSGLVCSGDWFVTDQGDVARILSHFPEALAVDMESGALAQTCAIYGVPFLNFRIVSDASGGDHQARYDHFWETAGVNSFTVLRHFLDILPNQL